MPLFNSFGGNNSNQRNTFATTLPERPANTNDIMKKNLCLALLFSTCLATFVTAQSTLSHTATPIDSRLYAIHSGEYLESLQSANPFLLKRWAFYLDHSWYLTDLPAEKAKEAATTVRVEDLDAINILLLEKQFALHRDWEKQTVIKIEKTDKAIVLISGKRFNELLNEHLSANK
ncbi:MAG: hypothetical protein IPN76_10745 [Saprospiraceae bacterium]|nr:hypothetical protein [Saprospiraceae bacterium]